MDCCYLSCCWSRWYFPWRRIRQVRIVNQYQCLPKTLWDCQAARHLVVELDLGRWLFPSITRSYPTHSKSSVYFVETFFVFSTEAIQQLAVYRIFSGQAIKLWILCFCISDLQLNYLHTWESMPLPFFFWSIRANLSFTDYFNCHQIFLHLCWFQELEGFLSFWLFSWRRVVKTRNRWRHLYRKVYT